MATRFTNFSGCGLPSSLESVFYVSLIQCGELRFEFQLEEVSMFSVEGYLPWRELVGNKKVASRLWEIEQIQLLEILIKLSMESDSRTIFIDTWLSTPLCQSIFFSFSTYFIYVDNLNSNLGFGPTLVQLWLMGHSRDSSESDSSYIPN